MKWDIGSQEKAPRPKHVFFRMKSNTDNPLERKQYGYNCFSRTNQSHKHGPFFAHKNPTFTQLLCLITFLNLYNNVKAVFSRKIHPVFWCSTPELTWSFLLALPKMSNRPSLEQLHGSFNGNTSNKPSNLPRNSTKFKCLPNCGGFPTHYRIYSELVQFQGPEVFWRVKTFKSSEVNKNTTR